MNIETALTLGLAVGILVVGVVLRLVVLTVLRVGLRLAGRETSWLRPQRLPRTERLPRPRPRGALRRAGAAGARGAARAGRGLATALRAGAQTAAAGTAALEQWADATNARLAPHTAELGLAARRSAALVGKRLSVLLVTFIATVQHFASLTATGVRHRLASRRATNAEPRPRDAGTPREARKVIDLDRDDDPLPPARPSRPTAGARL